MFIIWVFKYVDIYEVPGKRSVGRRKKSWLRNIREWTGVASAAQLFRLARDESNYGELIANLHKQVREIRSVVAIAAAAGAGVGGPRRVFARTTCDLHRITYSGCCLDNATNLIAQG
ncbi:hypothetical protein RR46_11981 [Papilio xuthus]|uniref:Uncharacterized protein n=1 Tax=Papilio xuthus TaxID=66420 RepID=A0A194PNT6_PAPXU|nr:hypothetical protein RR46_11981 [Papilio xuthus]